MKQQAVLLGRQIPARVIQKHFTAFGMKHKASIRRPQEPIGAGDLVERIFVLSVFSRMMHQNQCQVMRIRESFERENGIVIASVMAGVPTESPYSLERINHNQSGVWMLKDKLSQRIDQHFSLQFRTKSQMEPITCPVDFKHSVQPVLQPLLRVLQCQI